MTQARVELLADSRQVRRATDDLERLERRGGSVTKATSGMTTAFRALTGVLATLGAARAFGAVISATIEQERATAQLEQTLRSTGRFTEDLSEQMQQYASGLQQVTTFGDEAVISSQAMLLTFARIGEEEFPRAQEAILDVATAMGTDLKSAAIQVGKALNDPKRGMDALSRSGITLSDSQRKTIKEMVDLGNVAGAQRIILDELETQFGGSARAARDTFGGAIQSLKNSFGDLLEGDTEGGGVNGAVESINELTDTLNDPNIKKGFQTMVQGIVGITGALADGIAKLDQFGKFVNEVFRGSGDAIEITKQRLSETREELSRVESDLGRWRAFRLNPFASTEELEEQAAALRSQLGIYESTLEQLTKRSSEAKENFQLPNPIPPNVPTVASETGDSIEEAGKAAKETKSNFEDLADSLRAQIIEYELGEEAGENYRLMSQLNAGASREEAEAIAELSERVRQLREERETTQGFESLQGDIAQEGLTVQPQITGDMSQGEAEAERVRAETQTELALLEQRYMERTNLINQYRQTENADIQEANEAQLELTQQFEDQKTALESDGAEQRKAILEREAQARKQTHLAQVDSVAGFFGQLAELSKNGGKEQFESYKKFAIAQALIATYSSAQKSYDALAGIPVVGPALGGAAAAVAVASGLQQVQQIRSQQPPGRATGGQVLAGNEYLVGERGPEIVRMDTNGSVVPNSQLRNQTTNNSNRVNNANITFQMPEGDEGFRSRVVENEDLIYSVVRRALNEQGREF